MATLTGNSIASTYTQLLKITSATLGADASAKYIEDGAGTDSALSISTTRVGIGTASPDANLHIYEASIDAPLQITRANNTSNGMIKLETGTTDDWIIGERNDSTSDFRIYSYGTSSDVFSILRASGNVGIGTAAPASTLEVAGSGHAILLTDSGDSYNKRVEIADTSGSGGYLNIFNDSEVVTAKIRSYASSNVQAYFTAGNVGIGETTPAALLHLKHDAGTAILTLENTGGSGTDWNIFSHTDGQLYFLDGSTSRLELTAAGDVSISGDLKIADGKGIDFSNDASPAAGMTAEILDDYEEGTWDAVVTDGTTDMTMDGSYDTGYYTKVGNLVHVSGFFITTSLNGLAAETIRIIGLPFTVANNAAAYSSGSVGYCNNLDITAGESISYHTAINSTYINLSVTSAATGTIDMTASEWSADGRAIIGFSYRAA